MNPADTMRLLMDAYPRGYVDEVDCLHQLFFVNGNGMEWHRGELVDSSDPDATSPDTEIALERAVAGARYRRGAAAESIPGFYAARLAAHELGPAAERDAERAERILFGEAAHRRLYPLCRYAQILHIPPDVTEEWLAAAERALALIADGTLQSVDIDRDMPFLEDARALVWSLRQ